MLLLIVYFITRYLCNFHVRGYDECNVSETSTIIKNTLMSQYENNSITIQTLDVAIKHIGNR